MVRKERKIKTMQAWSVTRNGEGGRQLGVGNKKKGSKVVEEEEEEVPQLLDKALREIVKLPSSRMFYNHIKVWCAPNK
jgi:hypothetical protein